MDLVDTLQLMMKDNVVLEFDCELGDCRVINSQLLPYSLKGQLKEPYLCDGIYTPEDCRKSFRIRIHNDAIFTHFLASRVLPIYRGKAKHIYNLFAFPQLQNDIAKSKMAIACRALSLQDNYWLKYKNEHLTWNDVNLHSVELNNTVALVSLHGKSLSLSDKIQSAMKTPELTGQGMYAKAWFREPDGLYLYKLGLPVINDEGDLVSGSLESKIEVMVSNLLDNCNVDHLKYEAGESQGEYVCKCKCMTDDTIFILPGMDFDTWCNVRGLDSRKEALKIDPDSIYKMWIVDYLISNGDRHGLNWGFFYNCDTHEILKCHPLYDHNNSFDLDLMQDDNVEYLYDDSMTMKEAAMEAILQTGSTDPSWTGLTN